MKGSLASVAVCMLAVMLQAVASGAQAQAVYQEGKHYELITPPISVGSENEVVVTEFFWYGCGHCFNFEPMLQAWGNQLPEGARLEGSPAMWSPPMEVHARAYYVAKALGVLDDLHTKMFEAMHLKRKRLATEESLRAFFVENGVSAKDFDRAYDSFGITSQVRRADSHAKSARIAGTPSIMVNGKYRIETRMAGGQAEMLDVAKFLVEKELAASAEQTAQR